MRCFFVLRFFDLTCFIRLSDDSLRFDEYDDKYVRVLIDCIKVNTDSTLTVIIKGGVPITVDIPT